MADKIKIIILFNLLACLSSYGFGQAGKQITGNWKTLHTDKTLQMEIYLSENNLYYGKVSNDSSQASKNGTLILKALEYNETTKTYKGTMSPPGAGVDLSVTVTMENNDRIKIIAKKFLMSKTMYISRVK
jgi:hypothetical protein